MFEQEVLGPGTPSTVSEKHTISEWVHVRDPVDPLSMCQGADSEGQK